MIKTKSGFTIVELLIVIVVIGILAAITIVVYNGIQGRASDAAVQSDLRNFGAIIEQQGVLNGSYPLLPAASFGIKITKSAYNPSFNNLYYCVNSTGTLFAITAQSKAGHSYTYRSGSGVKSYTAVYGGASSCIDAGMASSDWRETGFDTASQTWATWIN
jgi:prepilin-type N-terminal cleavage/methylation domain-containing protein